VLSFRVRRRKTLHLLGNLETGKSKKEFCASLRFRIEKSCCRDKMGQNRTVWDNWGQIRRRWDSLGQSGTLSTDCDGATRCHKKPQKATKGHEKQQRATESHKNKSESRRQLTTKNYDWPQLETKSDKRRQLGTVRDSKAARVEMARRVLEHKGRWRGIACFWCQVRRNEIVTLWRFFGSCATNAPQAKVRGI
jgi:hypothetical protein